MSILIKGLEMPKDICGEPGYVDVRIFSDGSVIMVKAAPPYYGKFEAIPLPEGHGRLIKQYCEKSPSCGDCLAFSWCVAMRQGGGLNTPNHWPDPEEGGGE